METYINLNRRQAIDIITIDFSNAFDTVNISLLIQKLQQYGICSKLSSLLYTYLNNRYQQVLIDGILSEQELIASGVPQGFILSPTIFKIYIDELLKHKFYSHVYAFADNVKIVGYPGPEMQAILNYLSNWAKINFLKFNIAKCEVLHLGSNNISQEYSINVILIPSVSFIKDLGIYFDNELKFSKNISIIQAKCLRLIGALFKIFHYNKPELYLKFYKIYILPLVDYGSILFSGTSAAVDNNIEKF